MQIRVKHGSNTHTLDLAAENVVDCLYARIGEALDLPPSRLTIIRAGKKLPAAGDPALASHVAPGVLLLVSTSREELPSTSQRYLNEAKDTATSLYSRLNYDFFVALLWWLWGLLGGFARGSVAFVKSMVVAPDPANAGGRRQPVAQAQHMMPPG